MNQLMTLVFYVTRGSSSLVYETTNHRKSCDRVCSFVGLPLTSDRLQRLTALSMRRFVQVTALRGCAQHTRAKNKAVTEA